MSNERSRLTRCTPLSLRVVGSILLAGLAGALLLPITDVGASIGDVPISVGSGTSIKSSNSSSDVTATTPIPTTTNRGSSAVASGTASTVSVCQEFQFLDRINELRASRGIAGLTMVTVASDRARIHAQNMAAAGSIWHSDVGWLAGVAFGSSNWIKVGENVGRGGSVGSVFSALVASPSHLANMVDPAFKVIGVGSVEVPGGLYTSHFFGQIRTAVAVRPRPNCNLVSGPLLNSTFNNSATYWQFRPGAAGGGMNRQVYAHPWGNRFLEANCITYQGCSTYQDLVGQVPRGQRYRFEAYVRCNAPVACPARLAMWGLGVNPQEVRVAGFTIPANSGWIKYAVEGSFNAEHDRLRAEMYIDSVARNTDMYQPRVTRI